ncbi:flagellar export protein FliJ [bacterium]|nr:flagellar export protein FliJ [bacterium]
MKKFKFRMQTILEIREKKLDDERLKLAEIQNILNSQLDILNEMQFKRQEIIGKIDALQAQPEMNIPEIVALRNYLERVQSDIQTQLELIKRTQIRLDEQKIEVENAYKDLKSLENLKEKQEKEHYRNILMMEAKEIDDIAISRYKGDNKK